MKLPAGYLICISLHEDYEGGGVDAIYDDTRLALEDFEKRRPGPCTSVEASVWKVNYGAEDLPLYRACRVRRSMSLSELNIAVRKAIKVLDSGT